MTRWDSEAEDSYKQALVIKRLLSQGADSRDIARTLTNLGISYKAAGDESKAVETLREALDMTIRVDPDNPMISKIRDYLSSVTSTSSETQTSTDGETSDSSPPPSKYTKTDH